MTAPRRVLLILIVLLVLLLFLAVPGVSWADTLEEAVKGLARRIAAGLAARQDVALEVQNLSSLSAGQAGIVRRALESELTAAGHRVIAAGAGKGTVRVRLAENLGSYLIVAEVPEDGGPAVSMATIPKSAVAATGQSATSVIVRKELVLEQAGPILDFAVIPRPGSRIVLAVLHPEAITFQERERDHGGQESVVAFPAHKTWPRDLRGWLRIEQDHTEIFLPGLHAESGLGADSLWVRNWGAWHGRLTARSTGVDWTDYGLLVEGRNYFQRIELPGTAGTGSPTYYAAVKLAQFGPGGYVQWVRWLNTELEGPATLLDGTAEVRATFSGWGSEIAGITSKCGRGRQVLVTRAGDWTEADAIQAYEIVDDQASAVGAPAQFDGPVMALWTAEEETWVRAVVRNLKTGKYEAYRLTIACGE